MRFFDLFLADYLRNLVKNISLPLTLRNSINVTDIDMTTVCGLNGTEYECKCEENHVWPNDTCRAYQVCDGIVGGTCGCIQALPSDGPLCQRDINECKDAVSVCGQYSDCINIIGSHMCSCWSGFNTSNKDSPVSRNNSCQDINECLFSSSVCGPNSICTNEVGSYNCSCLDGFTPTNSSLPISNNNTCTDVQDCLETLEVCGPNSRCTNSIGGYNCSCLPGFTVTNRSQSVSTSNPCNVALPLTEYLIEIQINSMDSRITNQLRNLLMSFSLPYTISDSTNITEINITTVCSLNQTQYQCKCEGLFVWPNDTCHSYEACDVITDGSCTCINALPIDGQFCQLLPSKYVIDIDMRFFDLFLVDYLRNLVKNISLPLTLRNSINVTDIDMTTVCGLNGTEYECKCEENHVWPNDTCRAYQVCDGIVGGTCGCIQALPSDGPLCQRDINECKDAVSVCGQYSDCINIIGSHMCSCWSGFNTSNKDSPVSRNNSCQDINECLFSPSVCGPNSNCTNEIGSYSCSCLNGFTATNSSLLISINNTCRDINECLFSPSVCGPNANCTNELGSYNCSCLNGFTATNSSLLISISNTCRDVDECVEMSNICGPNSICNNTIGSYNCLCKTGYNVTNPNLPINSNNTCEDINECLFSPSVCGPNANCTNELGSYNCSCLNGFTATNSSLLVSINNMCRDVDECAELSNVCGPNSICNNTVGSYNCSCKTGYNVTDQNLPINSNNTCEDVDECAEISDVCGPNSICNNTVGSYNCSCKTGYNVTDQNLPINSNNKCKDVIECDKIPNICGPNSICSNTVGSYNCSCLDGFTATNPGLPNSIDNICTDVNECDKIPNICGPNSICSNTVGSYNCSCLDGFTATNPGLPNSIDNICTDVNECDKIPNICGPNSICSNTVGSYNCSCLDGFTATNPGLPNSIDNICTDVDECDKIPNICGPNSICSNTVGSYSCSCLDGFTATNPGLPNSIDNICIAVTTPTTTTTTTTTTSTTTSTTTTTTTTPVPPPPPAPTTVLRMSMKIDEVFDTSLEDPNNEKFKRIASTIEGAIEQNYKDVAAYEKGSVKVTRIRPGSIIADYEFKSTTSSPNSPEFAEANKQVVSTLIFKGLPVAVNAFTESVQQNLTTEKWYPEQNMVLKCTRPPSTEGTMRWTVNDQDTLDKVKYVLSPDSSTLTVNNVNERDKGRYACIIERTIPYIQWQDIVIQPQPNIIVGENVRTFECVAQTVSLKCCEEKNSVEWTQITSDDVVTTVDGCTTLQHTIKIENCGENTFICRLKNPALQVVTYGSKSVTVKSVKQAFSCKDETLGDGMEGQTVKGPCEKGKEGTIIYRCTSGKWVPEESNCVLQVIKNLEKEVEVLVVKDIPVFVSQLSTATVNNTQEITASPVTVQTIVEILVKVSDVSKAIIISQPVMENFLKTVDILVSTSAFNTWKDLNDDSKTDNTSTALLSAIETISSRLTDANFRIIETTVELNRNVTDSTSYSEISNLPNSTTEIEIPEIPINTSITVIVFTSLDSVLPTRNTTNTNSTNSTSQSDVRINGDVVVVNVDNKTKINNISFAFDITNQSLGNPQCVFWNFDLDAWDSTGCKVKPYISNGNETGKITCECNHTTSFSILMSPFSIDHIVLAYITYIGVSVSLASLIICLIIETIVWKSMTRNDTSYMRHVSIVNIAVSLLIANVCFIIGAAVAESEQPTSASRCSAVVFFMHFFYLALFFWMLISALLLFYRTVMVLSQMSRAKMMVIAFIVGYGAPLLIAVITVASTAGPQNYTSKRNACWLNWFESKALLAFVIPALTIVAINLLVLIVVLYKILRRGVGDTTQPDEKHALMVIARCVAILTPIFGLTWGFGIGTMVSQELGIHVVFALLNSLQGFFILVFGTLLDGKIREALAGKLSLRNLTSSNRTRSTSAGPSSSTGLGFFQRRRRRNVYNVSEASAFSGVASSNSSSGSDAFGNA
ncbi:uncharacterized protein LOC127183362 isoform X3 [Labeo rohita]|uniref:uncharacterized protein LOC127183362 isoform X3 n=1 Tax=Labeo rohita TaxID=84645 RepID=UPI0021E1C9E7|nr:uncharacterized protein LOC127183362 isoform X3 [Labeo rohita]